MKSTAEDVTTYIDEQPKQWQPTLRKLRAACRSQLRGYTEGMAYGMPSYEHGGGVEVSFGQQARYLSLYILKQPVLDAHRAELDGLSLGKGCVRFRRPDDVNWAVISALLAESYASPSRIC
jgi:uncharacterized protein YdhG (YjbR/CyaY superfamily)